MKCWLRLIVTLLNRCNEQICSEISEHLLSNVLPLWPCQNGIYSVMLGGYAIRHIVAVDTHSCIDTDSEISLVAIHNC